MTSTVAATAKASRIQTSPRAFPVILALSAAATLAALVTTPSDMTSLAVVMVVVAAFGIPHGAIDHLVATAIGPSAPSPPTRNAAAQIRSMRFHFAYLGAMVAYGLVWLTVPAVALAGFLLLSVHHFGQSDLAYLQLAPWSQGVIQLSRGLLLVGLLLVANLEQVSPVIEQMGGFDPFEWAWLGRHTATWSLALLGQHFVVGLFVCTKVRNRDIIQREVVTVIALTTLFFAADPLIGFAVYFGLWHSLNHLSVIAAVLGRRSGSASLTPQRLARLAAPRSAVSLVALVALGAGAAAFDQTELIVPISLVFVSMLTLPHMVVVERMWRAIRLTSPPNRLSA